MRCPGSLSRKFRDFSITSVLCNTPLPENRHSGYSITCIHEDTVILAGGFRSHPSTSKLTKLPSVFAGKLNKSEEDVIWTRLPSMKELRDCHAAFNLENKLYVVGGRDNSGKWINSCEVFDIENRKWSDGANLPNALSYPTAVTNHAHSFSVVIGGNSKNYEELCILILDRDLMFKETAPVNSLFCYLNYSALTLTEVI